MEKGNPTEHNGLIQSRQIGKINDVCLSMEMSRLTRDGTAEPVSGDQILRHARGQGNIIFPVQLTTQQDWQPYPVDPYSAICDDHTVVVVVASNS